MKKLISRRNFLAAMGTMAAAGVLTACGGSSSGTASSAAARSRFCRERCRIRACRSCPAGRRVHG